MISKSEKCPALSGRALLCLFVSGCEEVAIHILIAEIFILWGIGANTRHITRKKHNSGHGIIRISACTNIMVSFAYACACYTGAEFKALKVHQRLYIAFFHLNFTLLYQNQRPNKSSSHPQPGLVGLAEITLSEAICGALLVPSALTAITV